MLWISDEWKEYEVLDTSGGERLERWGKFILVRPDPQVIWDTPRTVPQWKRYDARYVRSNTGGGHWTDNKLPERWQIHYKDYLTFNVKPMNFKHTGVFPEQAANWDFIREKVAAASADALGETGKGTANFFIVIGIIETVALFTLVFSLLLLQ